MDIWSRSIPHPLLLASHEVVIFTRPCDGSLTAFSSACEPRVDGGNLMASLFFFFFASARGGVCALPPVLLLVLLLLAPFSPCPQLKRGSKMQLASQKGQQTRGHRGCGSCHGRLSWGRPSCRVFWVTWHNERCELVEKVAEYFCLC